VRSGHDHETVVLLRTLHVLSGAWAECELRKVAWTYGLLRDEQRHKILYMSGKRRDQSGRWEQLVELALTRRYKVQKYAKLPQIAQAWSKQFTSYLQDFVAPLMDDRNALAHGGWAAALESDKPIIPKGDGPAFIATIEPDDYLLLRMRRDMVKLVGATLEELVAIPTTKDGEARLAARMTTHLSDAEAAAARFASHDATTVVALLRTRPHRPAPPATLAGLA
jgi:hypothetical protein